MASGPYIQHHGAAVVAIGYSLVIVTLSFTAARLYTTLRRKQGFRVDDWIFLVANGVALAQSIIVDSAVHAGLGNHFSSLSPSSRDNFFKFMYIAQLLSIAAQYLAKVSVVLLIGRLDTKKSTQLNCHIVHAMCLTWVLFSIFTISFQCGLPKPWTFNENRCVAGGKLYYVIILINIITDATIALFFLPVVWKLQMARDGRITIMSVFASRLSVCGVSIGNMAVLGSYINSSDITWNAIGPTILNSVAMNLSIITAGIPSVHRFLGDLQTGRIGIRLNELEIEMSASGSRSKSRFRSRNDTYSKNSSKATSSSQSAPSLKLTPPNRGAVSTHISGSRDPEADAIYRSQRNEDDVAEDSSTSSLKRNVVFQTREVLVEYESNQHSGPS